MKSLFKAYKYLYYKLYHWNLSMHGKSDIPEFNAMLITGLLVFMNVFSIPAFIEALTGYHVLSYFDLPEVLLWVIVIGYMGVNYFTLYSHERYKKIIKEFEAEGAEQKRRGSVKVLIYITLSVVALFGSWFGIYLRREIFGL